MLDASARDSWQVLTDRLGAFLRRQLPSQDVDAVLPEVLLRIHRNARHLNDETRFGSWVYAIARNAVIDRLRQKTPVMEPLELGAIDRAFEPESEQALVDCVAPFVARLPEAYRHAITLVELQGLTQAEAARIAGVSLSGMKSRVQRGRGLMRTMFEECCDLTIDARGRIVEAGQRQSCATDGSCAAPVVNPN